MDEQQLKIAVAQARQRGEKVVMTNGIFDILHAGHVSIWPMPVSWGIA